MSAAEVRESASTPERCSAIWRDAERVGFGTAPVAAFWVGVEQPGPWGRKAFVESRLDPDLGKRLDSEVAAAGGRAVLIRRPDTRADHDAERTLLVATGLGDLPVVGRRVVAPEQMAEAVDALLAQLDAVSAGELPRGFEPAPASLLVCSNGKRDQCCAIEARPLLRDLAADASARDRVWETTHLGGHRFAPTAVALPTGQMVAWIDAPAARELLAAASTGQLWPGGAHRERGRTHLEPAVQAVDVHLRGMLGERRCDALSYHAEATLAGVGAGSMVGRTGTVEARHADGRRWRFAVGAVAASELPDSCGKVAVPGADWVVREL